jgi:aspartate carbamoyltransferase catalytic subunit
METATALGKDLVGLEHLSAEQLRALLDTAEPFKEISERQIKKVPVLRGKTIVNLFFEASTRTRVSFEFAEKRLSADTVNIASTGSSVAKGETLVDTARNLEAMRIDMVVIRHGSSGAAQFLAERIPSNVINAGDGRHEHPTQGLLDMLTIRLRKGSFDDLVVTIAGDIQHSRVARSAHHALTTLGVGELRLVAPPALAPDPAEFHGARLLDNIEEGVRDADVVMCLRIQRERMEVSRNPDPADFYRRFGLTPERLALARPDAIVMHPGPMNPDVEIAGSVADSPQSVIAEQVTNGVAVRMAVMHTVMATLHG